MSYSIKNIEGIGSVDTKKLGKAKVRTTGALLKAAKTKAHRKELADISGVTEKKILEWANRADLMRIRGVAEEYSDLLERAGVDTVKELATRNADNLAVKMEEVNKRKKVVRLVPSEKTVKKWIAHAKKLRPTLEY